MEENKPQYHFHITSNRRWFDLNLKEVWQYRDLIVLFTKRNFALTYKQTVLGPIWLFLNPFITSVIHTLVFGGIAGIETDGVPKILFYMSSNAIWAFFATCINSNANSFRQNSGTFGKVYFPRLTVPISHMLVAIIRFFIQMLMVGGFLVYYLFQGKVQPNWAWWPMIPVVLLQLGVMGMGVGLFVSSMTTKYRDLAMLVGFGVQLWMYATPIVYPLSTLGPGRMRMALLINPVTMPVEIFRYALIGRGTIIPEYVALSCVFTLLMISLGVLVYNHVERTFMDTV